MLKLQRNAPCTYGTFQLKDVLLRNHFLRLLFYKYIQNMNFMCVRVWD